MRRSRVPRRRLTSRSSIALSGEWVFRSLSRSPCDARGRGGGAALLLVPQHLCEVLGELEGGRWCGWIGLPHEAFGQQRGAFVGWEPALDHSRVEVHDPVLRYALSLIEPALGESVVAGRAWRQHLDREEQTAHVFPDAQLGS